MDGTEPAEDGNRIAMATVENPVCEEVAFQRGGTVELVAE
jgi:hypothetical protein